MKNTTSPLFLLVILASSLFSSCDFSEKGKTISTQIEQPVTYEIPAPKSITEKERKRIYAECKMFYDTLLNPSGFNGGIIVAKGGNIIFEKYKGSINLNGIDSITASTPLHIASVSKTFTAMTILKLQEQGKLSISDTLTKFFPNFNYPAVTIKTLLNHRSGLPNYLYFMNDLGWNKDSIIENKDILQWLIEKKLAMKDIAPADTKFSYSNTNYALLALIIEKVTGKSYPEYLYKNIFRPLGMTNTFVHHGGDTMIRSKSFDWKGREMPDNNLDNVYGDKNIYSTVQDLLKWDRALTNNIFLNAKTLETAYAPYSNEKPGIKNYGLGWRMNIYGEAKKIIFHNGWWHGNNAAFIRLPTEDATIICLSNRFARSVYSSKLLVNVFGNYFDAVEEDSENIVPAAIPEIFPNETKKNKGKRTEYDFSDRNKKETP
jgi:CubicO group peptidase (beta-lactamase class C family)